MTLEEQFEKLEQIISRMEQKDQTLEEAFADYEDGMKLVKSCQEALNGVEKKLQIIEENRNSAKEETE